MILMECFETTLHRKENDITRIILSREMGTRLVL